MSLQSERYKVDPDNPNLLQILIMAIRLTTENMSRSVPLNIREGESSGPWSQMALLTTVPEVLTPGHTPRQ